MKKICSVILSLILLAACALPAFAAGEGGSFGAYDHVFIIGADGVGRFFKDANTPNFDRIFENGAVNYTARTETVTISAQNWGAILGGVSYLKHKLTNSGAAKKQRASDTKFPTIFTCARKAFPDAALASFVNWHVVNYGIIENDIDVTKVHVGNDEALTEEICAYFNEGNAPKLFFCHFDSVDEIGHDYGSKAPEYFARIEAIDGYIGRIYDTLTEKGLMENGLFIVVSDHGHLISGGHWGLTARESNTTVAIAGKNVVAGSTLDKKTRNRDVAAIALYALGIKRPDYMTARLPAHLFADEAGEKRPFFKDVPDAVISALAWMITFCTSWI